VIVNITGTGLDDAMTAAAALPGGLEVWRRLRDGSEPFLVVPGRTGLEWGVDNRVKDAPNRARLKLFVPEGRTDLAVLVAFKISQVAWSHDRYAYGVWEIPLTDGRAVLDPAHLEAWIAFQVSGFHPERRPPTLIRQISYDIPE